jgi:basic membrane protein A
MSRLYERRPLALMAVFVTLVTMLAVAGCGGSSPSGTTELKVAAALIGPKNDESFNQAAYEGLQKFITENPGKLKLTSVLENLDTDQARTDAIERLAPINDLVLAVSASFGPVLDVEAPKFPNTKFFNIAGYTKQFNKNVYAFANDWGAPAYPMGAVAATLTKTGVIGYVGGAEIPPTVQAMNAYVAAAKAVNPNIKVLTNIVGDFNDVAKAKQATAAMIADKADVIFPFLDAGIPGAYAAATESGKNPALFKLTIADCTTYSNMVGTEIVNNIVATDRMLTLYTKGTLQAGAFFLDLQDPNIQTLQLCPKYQSDAKISAVAKQTIDDINSGKIKLPANAINPRVTYQHTEGFPAA